ncbi:MAG: hypothetical protein RLZ39_722 [Bacteroidota bacterium]|jgi:hypothetical protein
MYWFKLFVIGYFDLLICKLVDNTMQIGYYICVMELVILHRKDRDFLESSKFFSFFSTFLTLKLNYTFVYILESKICYLNSTIPKLLLSTKATAL